MPVKRAIRIRHDAALDLPIHRVQMVGRGGREPLNNLCEEMILPAPRAPFDGLWEAWKLADTHRPKPMSLKAIQAACKAAGDVKRGIGYGHPAHRGFFAGKAQKRARNPIGCADADVDFMMPEFVPHDLGKRGVMVMGWEALGLGLMQPESTAKRLEREAVEAVAYRRDKEREKANACRRVAMKIEAEILVQVLIDKLQDPDVDVCRTLVDYAVSLKANDVTRYAVTALDSAIKATRFRMLGNGYFSTALLGPDGYVYKVNCNNASLDSWVGYAVNCIEKPNPHTPRVYKIEISGNSYCAKMELLNPVSEISGFDWYERCGSYKFEGFESDCLESVMHSFDAREFDAFNLMKLVSKTKKDTQGRFDIHSDNIMLRMHTDGSHTIVLTDPLSFGSFNMRSVEKRLA